MAVSQAVASTEARNLTNIASQIADAHAKVLSAFRSAVVSAVEAGQLLIEAKAQVAYGEWEGWVEKTTAVSPRSARGYMQLARHWLTLDDTKRRHVADLGVRAALKEMVSATNCRPERVFEDGDDEDEDEDNPEYLQEVVYNNPEATLITPVIRKGPGDQPTPRPPQVIEGVAVSSGDWPHPGHKLDQLEPSLKTLRKIAARTDPSEASEWLREGDLTAADVEEITAFLASLEID